MIAAPVVTPTSAHARSLETDLGFSYLAVYSQVKQCLEPILALMLLSLLAPVFLIVVMVIKFDDGGPIFFRQLRMGAQGRLFELLKFRTMRADADPYHVKPRSGEAWKITRVGHFLRNHGLDELPQLLSVIRGDMQLIGPRPEMPQIAQRYTPRERLRLLVKPGITGYWQVCGPKNEPMHHNLDFDLHYLTHQGFGLDVWIVKETVKILAGLRQR
jgi:lipopolysaccharide/colanic/teichoic acid biosynthesis glycosyltransferase